MKVISYLAFTLLSIIIQFAVMDLIQSKQKLGQKAIPVDLNMSSPKKQFRDALKELGNKPHALFYYSKPNARLDKNNLSAKIYTNSSLNDISLETSTEISSTIVDVFFDENTFTTEPDSSTSTEPLLSTTELENDNVTEITLFEKKNTTNTTVKPKVTPKKKLVSKDCDCNLLYEVCDINCCCDSDCTDGELKMFTCFDEPKMRSQDVSCDAQHTLTSYLIGSSVDNLFCVVKTNLPAKRIINRNYKHDTTIVNRSLKWHANSRTSTAQYFEKKFYKYGDPIWVLKNNSVYYIDLPSSVTNNYCSVRRPVKFLQDEKINCNVKLVDLEICQILGTSDYAPVISVLNKTQNSTVLNCTTLHCTNWTTVVCDDTTCVDYDKKVHEPLCSESSCTRLALRVDYLFYYYDSKITNVTIKFYTRNVSLNMPFFAQEVNVNFLLANESFDQIISLSGNPGYISGLPVIVSRAEANHTDGFYNKTSKLNKYLEYPENFNGICASTVSDKMQVMFAVNKRLKCRYTYIHNIALHNATATCRNIQREIKPLFGLKNKLAISPFGNPLKIKDEEWLTLSEPSFDENLIFAEFNTQKTKIVCYNLLTRASLVFSFADVSDVVGKRVNKILSAQLETTARNVTFNVEDMSVVVTIDFMFIDESKPTVYEYAAGPNLNIHLPKDFFFPINSNNCYNFKCNVFLVFVFACILFVISK